jgi:uncharacterized integral membrane protein
VTTPDPHPTNPPGTDPTLGAPGGDLRGTQPPAPAPTAPATDTRPAPTRHKGRAIGRTLAAALLIAVTVVLVLFVVFNTQTVDISLVFADVEAPLVLALVIAAGLGGLFVALLGAVMRARRRNR